MSFANHREQINLEPQPEESSDVERERLTKLLADTTARKNEFLERIQQFQERGLDANPLKMTAEKLISKEDKLRGQLGLSTIPRNGHEGGSN
jgi:hypothetical protein